MISSTPKQLKTDSLDQLLIPDDFQPSAMKIIVDFSSNPQDFESEIVPLIPSRKGIEYELVHVYSDDETGFDVTCDFNEEYSGEWDEPDEPVVRLVAYISISLADSVEFIQSFKQSFPFVNIFYD